MDKEQALRCANDYAKAVYQMLDGAQVILFGSYAKGTQTDNSDIDIAVICNVPDLNWWQISTKLCELSFDYDSKIEPILLTPQCDLNGFRTEVMTNGILLTA